MNQFQALLARLAAQQQKDASAESPDSAQQQNGEPATVKLAERISERLLGHPLSDDAKQLADPIVHYTCGAVWGGIYCAMAEIMPETAKTAGLVFGGGLWLAGDEVAVPALGLSKSPTEYPLSTHAQALAAPGLRRHRRRGAQDRAAGSCFEPRSGRRRIATA
jgi:hypothetical protein